MGSETNAHICLFVCSSDNTLDVFHQVGRCFERFWPDCPFARFVGLNSNTTRTVTYGFQPIRVPVGGWRVELMEQIRRLPDQYGYILLFLDDFLILSPVNGEPLSRLLDAGLRHKMDYLRLVPVKRAALARIAHRFRNGSGNEIEQIGEHAPYYSSLQVAMWKRSHLIAMLKSTERDIWTFEHQRIDGHRHFAITGKSPIQYIHVVEKGRWQAYSPRLFDKLNLSFETGNRIVLGRQAYFRWWLDRIKFEVVGYAIMRLKRYLREHSWLRSPRRLRSATRHGGRDLQNPSSSRA